MGGMRYSILSLVLLTAVAAVYLALIQAGPIGFVLLGVTVALAIRQLFLLKQDLDRR
jgi:hypothetical protein